MGPHFYFKQLVQLVFFNSDAVRNSNGSLTAWLPSETEAALWPKSPLGRPMHAVGSQFKYSQVWP